MNNVNLDLSAIILRYEETMATPMGPTVRTLQLIDKDTGTQFDRFTVINFLIFPLYFYVGLVVVELTTPPINLNFDMFRAQALVALFTDDNTEVVDLTMDDENAEADDDSANEGT